MLSVFQVVCKRFRLALFLSSGMEQGARTHAHRALLLDDKQIQHNVQET
jgi:hypothetical protein